jgi:hypothetical protein
MAVTFQFIHHLINVQHMFVIWFRWYCENKKFAFNFVVILYPLQSALQSILNTVKPHCIIPPEISPTNPFLVQFNLMHNTAYDVSRPLFMVWLYFSKDSKPPCKIWSALQSIIGTVKPVKQDNFIRKREKDNRCPYRN